MTRWILPLALLAATLPAYAHEFTRGTLQIHHPWALPSAPAQRTGAAWLEIHNQGQHAERLLGASSPAAAVSLHETRQQDGMMQMRPLPNGIDLPPGSRLKLAPGGMHLMLENLRAPLAAGQRLPLILHFRDAGPVAVQILIETPNP